ncbi:CheR family methyltransferase [Xanthomonas sp. NCPPB 2632]|uniref:CheR family methyltransferase n=1 Tax=Xanthomonas sp. NCPPB 2632 TaxID=3240912 RepID=UPI003511EE30
MSESSTPLTPDTVSPLRESHLDFPVIGIGTSAGGLAALARFLEALPAEPEVAFVVVMHLSPRHDSIADQILQRSTAMRVIQVNEPTPLRKNEVYVISPRQGLSMTDGYLRLVELDRPRGKHVAIDFFFRTLAEVHRERAMAVILTGTGSDGSVGIARIRERGGITFAQHPDDAEYDQMPRAAIATGAVDIVLPVAELPERILLLARESARIALPDLGEPPDTSPDSPPPPAGSPLDEDALRDIMLILRAKTGHDFRSYKRATVLRRIERRMQVNGVATLAAYRDFLHDHPVERPALLKDMLISVTNFFRDREAFDALERAVVPQLFDKADENHRVRAWCAGCATGEEAYSVAMVLAEAAAATDAAVQVFATDIDDDAIAHARQGRYPSAVATDIAPGRVTRFLTRDDNVYRVAKPLRECLLFARHNVLQDPPFSKLDLITCRNLLIYLNRDVQAHVLEMFHFALRPGGFLFLGSSESAEVAAKFFTPVDKKHRIYRANLIPRSGMYLQAPTRQLPVQSAVSAAAQQAAQERRTRSLAEVHRRAVEDRLPPSILIDREGQVAHVSERAGSYLRMTGGPPSYQLTSLIVPELRLELRAALYQASQEERAVHSPAMRLQRNGDALSVTVEVRPVGDKDTDAGYQLVIFHEQKTSGEPTLVDADAVEQTPILLQMEEELRRAREQLQVTLEESETSGEELKASNEELQSINEELRSATEELETSKEELQSINEELITVNHELKMKVDETAKVNDDLHNLVASTDIATVFVDRDMCIKRFTPRAADVFRLIPADVGRSLLDLNHSLDYPDLPADAEQAFHSLRSIDREVGSQDGRWYIARILPYRTAEDRIEGAVLTFIDITRRRNAEETARSSEERMRLVADSAVDYAIITTDPDGFITSWSRGAERIFRYSASDAIGLHGDLIFTPEDRSRGAFRREMEIASNEGRANDDRWHIRGDGQRIFCSGITTPLRQGGFHGYAKIARDVTADKQRELEREDLLSVEAADAILRTVAGQAQVIDDLLDLSRLNTGTLALELAPLNLCECIRRVVDDMRDDLSRQQVGITLTLPDDDLVIAADATRVRQVAWNLLSNALKFSREGGGIRVDLHADDDHAVLRIQDDGVGIAAERLPRLFDMFEEGPDRRPRSRGLGIGLALVHHLLVLHGGSVGATSDGVDKGSVFTAVIPRRSTPSA